MTDGTLETRPDGTYVLRYERRLSHPIDRVWAALTEPAEIEAWLARAQLDLSEGGRVRLEWLNTDDEGNTAVADGRITRLEPPRLIEYDTDIHGLLRWDLEPAGDDATQTHLTLTVAARLPEEYIAKVRAGWHVHVDFLEDALDGRPVDWDAWPRDRWEVHHERYLAQAR
jgi:uncharacterized protein YndB with AHSA1/START domain